MKQALILAVAAAAALSVAACQKTDSQPSAADPGTGNDAVNAAQDATSAAVGAVSATQISTEDFVTSAAISDMYEIQAGQIAQKKGQSADVKAFGKTMVTDHTALSKELKPLITAAGKTPPAGLDERRKGLIDNLNAASAGEFDQVYLKQQEAAHDEALKLMQNYAEKGDDLGLKAAASKAVPKVQAHLDHAKQLLAAPAAPATK